MQTLAGFAPRMELYSIDEAFLDLTPLLNQDLDKLAREIRRTVGKNIGIPVSVGIAPIKTLAKMANRYAKKEGVFLASDAGRIEKMMSATQVHDVWGIGHQYAQFLEKNGFHTAQDLVKAPEDWIRKNLTVVGLRLLNELRGCSAIEWEEAPKPRKNICTSRSFGVLLSDKAPIAQAVTDHASSCSAKLRREKSIAGTIEVFIQTNPHRLQDDQYRHAVTVSLDEPSSDSRVLVKAALKALDIIYKPRHKYMKCGVTVAGLVSESSVQRALFSVPGSEKHQLIMQAMDSINGEVGRGAIRLAAQGFDKPYALKAGFLSRKYSTDLNQIVQIRI